MVVEEGAVGALGRVSVRDADAPGTPAWSVIYDVQEGDPEDSFSIKTEAGTNEGLVFVLKVRQMLQLLFYLSLCIRLLSY